MVVSKFCDAWFVNIGRLNVIVRNPWDMGPYNKPVEEINEEDFNHYWDEEPSPEEAESIMKTLLRRCDDSMLRNKIKAAFAKHPDNLNDKAAAVASAVENHLGNLGIIVDRVEKHVNKNKVKFLINDAKQVTNDLNAWAASQHSIIKFRYIDKYFDNKTATVRECVIAQW